MGKIKKVKLGVIGTGDISDIYIQNMIEKFSILDVVGCASKSGITAKKKADKYYIRHMTVEDMLKDDSIELIVNLTPPGEHYQIIKASLEAGKHVYTEKVITTDLDQAKELVSLAEEKNLLLGCSPDTFLGAAIQTARNAIETGMIGTVTSAVAVDNRDMIAFGELLPWTNTKGGSMGIDLGIYYITALVSILGSIKEVNGMSFTSDRERHHRIMKLGKFGETYEMKADSITAGTLRFENDVVVSLHMNAESIFPEKPYLTIYGTEGILYMADPNHFGGDVKLLTKGNEEPIILPVSYGYGENARGVGVAELAWSLRNNRGPRACKELGLHSMEALFGIVESGKSGKAYKIESSYEKRPPLPKGYCGEKYLGVDEEGALVK